MDPKTEKLVIKLLICSIVVGLGMLCCSGITIAVHLLRQVVG